MGVYHFHVSNLSQPIIYLQLQTLAQNLHNPNVTSGTVADLIDKTSCTWKLDLLKALYPFPLCKDTLGIPLSKTGVVADQLMWKYSNSGDYNVKKAYQVLLQDTNLQSPANHLHFPPTPHPPARLYGTLFGRLRCPQKYAIVFGHLFMIAYQPSIL